MICVHPIRYSDAVVWADTSDSDNEASDDNDHDAAADGTERRLQDEEMEGNETMPLRGR